MEKETIYDTVDAPTDAKLVRQWHVGAGGEGGAGGERGKEEQEEKETTKEDMKEEEEMKEILGKREDAFDAPWLEKKRAQNMQADR